MDLEPGYVWAPYIPKNLESRIFEYRKKIMTVKDWLNMKTYGVDVEAELTRTLTEEIGKLTESRYAAKKINPKFYGVINVDNLDNK